MNFLSHFYFDRTTTNCYHVLGTLLPDLLKNADKSIILHPEKLQHKDERIMSIISGWKKHLAVDRLFHSSDFFLNHSHLLKKVLQPVIIGSPVKPFFLGHIALELILDNLLLTTGVIKVSQFYSHLESCEDEVIYEFLTLSGMKNPQIFLDFFADFKEHKYLHTYAETVQVAYALKRICMRVWDSPFTTQQEYDLNTVVVKYRGSLKAEFMNIFHQIDSWLQLPKAS